MSRFLFAALLLAATPLFAADRAFDLTGWAAWVDTNSSGTFNATSPNQPFDISFNGKLGYGLGANIFWGQHVSTAVDIVQVRPQPTARTRTAGPGAGFAQNGFRMTPITGILQWHFMPKGFIDPYIGGGAAYVIFDRVNGRGVPNLTRIDFKDDVGLALNGGVSFGFGRLGLNVDGKYVPLKSSADAVFTSGTTTTKVKINPAIFSAGLSLRF